MKNEYDVLIAGSGVAGLYAALNFAPDVRVLVLSKREQTLCNSFLAQGGVAAVVDKTFGGSLPRFVAAFLNSKPISEAEAAEIRALLDAAQQKEG